jgi:hypothetical protein
LSSANRCVPASRREVLGNGHKRKGHQLSVLPSRFLRRCRAARAEPSRRPAYPWRRGRGGSATPPPVPISGPHRERGTDQFPHRMTSRVTVVVWVTPPPVALMVIV